ncbi:MAG: hypothetical protein ACTSRB_09300 [Candidatus Helarchaeota archaeon]
MKRRISKEINGKKIEIPFFIPALTTVRNFHSYSNLLKVLIERNVSNFMISAYDVYSFLEEGKKHFFDFLKNNSKSIIFLDSGAYETYYLQKKNSWNNRKLIRVVNEIKPDVIVSLDLISNEPQSKIDFTIKNYEEIRKRVKDDKFLFEIVIQDIELDKIQKYLNKLPIDEKLLAICFPERNLGFSFTKRIKTLEKIVDLLKTNGWYSKVLIHLMGCSDPQLIKEYVKYGIDIFDGVHWQDSTAHHKNYHLIDYSRLLELECNCEYCSEFRKIIKNDIEMLEKHYNYYNLNHNLTFYADFMKMIRESEA